MIRIAIDGMGGDYAPQVVVDGTVQAVNSFSDIECILVGQEVALKRELNRHRVVGGKIFIHHASQVVEMGESPVSALKKKKDSSVAVCIDLLKRKEVDAVVTAGNTGAAVAASMLTLGLLPGIRRPGIAISVPTLRGISLAIDVGANIDPAPEHLLQYAVMADVYSRAIFKKRRPSIGLLNVGEEESKGTELMKEAYRLLRDSKLNFIGNIEGRDFFSGKCDCVICDGFVGNVVLKVAESLLEVLVRIIQKEFSKSYLTQFGAWLCSPALKSIKKDTNYEEAGGAPLLGINGVVIISHGGSSANAIRNAINVASQQVTMDINSQIVHEIEQRETSTSESCASKAITGSANKSEKASS